MRNHLETNGKDGGEGRSDEGRERMVVFRIGPRRYALAVAAVLAVGEGAAAYRGSAVPVLEPGELGFGAPIRGPGGPFLVIGSGEAPRALPVDAVEGIVAAVEVRGWPALLAPVVGPGFPGVAAGGDGELVVVDVGQLLAERGPTGKRSPHEEAGETS